MLWAASRCWRPSAGLQAQPPPPSSTASSTEAARASVSRRRLRSSAALTCACGPLQLRLPQPLRRPTQVGRHRLGHLAGVGRAASRLGRQAALRQADQLRVGPAAVQPAERLGQVALLAWRRRLADAAGEGRLAGEDLAQDRAQAEHVGPLVEPLDLAAGLLGRPCRPACPAPLPACVCAAVRRCAPSG